MAIIVTGSLRTALMDKEMHFRCPLFVSVLSLSLFSVKSSYPTEVGHINECEDKIQASWDALKQQTEDKKADLEEARNIASFENESKQLVSCRCRVSTEKLTFIFQCWWLWKLLGWHNLDKKLGKICQQCFPALTVKCLCPDVWFPFDIYRIVFLNNNDFFYLFRWPGQWKWNLS